MSDTYEGGCHCGQVRYSISADPMWGGHCQCTNCQKFTGTGHASNFLVPLDAFYVKGDMSTYSYGADSGNTMTRYTCANCASPIYGNGTGNPTVAIIRAGSLDNPGTFSAKAVIYTDSGQGWDICDADLPTFPKMPQR